MATKGRLIRREETRARAESFAAQRAIPARADLSSRTRWTSRSDGGARGRRGEGAGVIAERCPRNAAETHRSRVASCRRLFRDETRGPPCSAIKSMPSRGWLPSTLLYVRCDSSTPPPPPAPFRRCWRNTTRPRLPAERARWTTIAQIALGKLAGARRSRDRCWEL